MTKYKIELDGIETLEEYNSFEDALDGAHLYFAGNRDIEAAVIYRVNKEQVGATYNKERTGATTRIIIN